MRWLMICAFLAAPAAPGAPVVSISGEIVPDILSADQPWSTFDWQANFTHDELFFANFTVVNLNPYPIEIDRISFELIDVDLVSNDFLGNFSFEPHLGLARGCPFEAGTLRTPSTITERTCTTERVVEVPSGRTLSFTTRELLPGSSASWQKQPKLVFHGFASAHNLSNALGLLNNRIDLDLDNIRVVAHAIPEPASAALVAAALALLLAQRRHRVDSRRP